MKRILFAAVSALAFLAAPVPSSRAGEVPPPLKTASAGKLGTVLTGPTGMTLYVYAMDTEPGKSACTGGCAQSWPPFRPAANASAPKAPLSIIRRDDGTKQYAYKGDPLYYWSGDKKPGETSGHNLGDVWSVAKP